MSELALAAIGCIQRMATDGFHKIFQTEIELSREAQSRLAASMACTALLAASARPTLFFFMPGREKSHAVADANRNRRRFEQQYYEILMYRIGETAVAQARLRRGAGARRKSLGSADMNKLSERF